MLTPTFGLLHLNHYLPSRVSLLKFQKRSLVTSHVKVSSTFERYDRLRNNAVSALTRNTHQTQLLASSNIITDRIPPLDFDEGTALLFISSQRIAVFDGAELFALKEFLRKENGAEETNKKSTPALLNSRKFHDVDDDNDRIGIMNVVAGTIALSNGKQNENVRVVGVQMTKTQDNFIPGKKSIAISSSANHDYVHLDSLARIPHGISNNDAISTLVASIVGVHCAVPRINKVGGDVQGDDFISGKAVVMGGGRYGIFAAE